MLAQVILVMRTPFKGKRAIGAQEGTHSSVDTLMDLEIDRDRDVKYLSFVKLGLSSFKLVTWHPFHMRGFSFQVG